MQNISVKKWSKNDYNRMVINSIKTKYKHLRSESKAVTFALNYQGTAYTLEKNSGFSPEEAQRLYEVDQELHKVSHNWVKEKVKEASRKGYMSLAFGLKLRCPSLNLTVLGNSKSVHAVEKHVRTLCNAVSGQSYGMLNTRAMIEFMNRVWASKWKYDIKPTALIHDALYFVVKNDVECVKWVNDNLIDCMKWQELPEIQSENIKLGANLELYYHGWHRPIELTNNASVDEIFEIVEKGLGNDKS